MTALFGSMSGLFVAQENQGDLSALGARRCLFSSEQAYKHNGNAPSFSCGGNDMHGDIGDVPEICA